MALTDAELQGFAAQALNVAKRDIEQDKFNFLLASYHEGDTPPFHRMCSIEADILEHLGEDWLNHSGKKQAGFHVLRLACRLLPPDALAFVTAANCFRSTDKFHLLPEAQREGMLNAGHNRHHQMAKEGLLELRDTLVAIAQTPTRVCNYIQEMDGGKFVGQPKTHFFPQDDFEGSMKMYGGGNAPYFTFQQGRRRQ